jgi:hypothetical protein
MSIGIGVKCSGRRRLRVHLGAGLGAKRIQEAWADGQQLLLDEAVALTLQEDISEVRLTLSCHAASQLTMADPCPTAPG